MDADPITLVWHGREFEAPRPTFAMLDIRFMADLADLYVAKAREIREADERGAPGDAAIEARAIRIADDAARELRERAYRLADDLGLREIAIACGAPDEPEDAATDASIEFLAAIRAALNARLADRGKSAPRSSPAA